MSDIFELRLSERSSASAAEVIAGAREFSRERIAIWPNVSPVGYEVHALGETFAEVTEKALRGFAWERGRYEWSPEALSVLHTVIESNVLLPGSTWELTARPVGGGCEVEAVFRRRFKRTPKGRFAELFNRCAGRLGYGSDLRRALKQIERRDVHAARRPIEVSGRGALRAARAGGDDR